MPPEYAEFLSILEKSQLLGRIDERVKFITEQLPHLASCESVEVLKKDIIRVEVKIDGHIEESKEEEEKEKDDRQWTVGQVVTAIGALGGIALGLLSLLSKR